MIKITESDTNDTNYLTVYDSWFPFIAKKLISPLELPNDCDTECIVMNPNGETYKTRAGTLYLNKYDAMDIYEDHCD